MLIVIQSYKLLGGYTVDNSLLFIWVVDLAGAFQSPCAAFQVTKTNYKSMKMLSNGKCDEIIIYSDLSSSEEKGADKLKIKRDFW